MKQLRDTVWQRRGTSLIWDGEALAKICVPGEVWSLREMLRAVNCWPRDLPSNSSNTLVVAGLDGGLDLLTPPDAEIWLGGAIKSAILSFQSVFQDEAALIFWLPSVQGRLRIQPATDTVTWLCPPHYAAVTLDFGRIIWGEASEYPQEIVLREGGDPAGLFHGRIA
jgi:hypothetical protein